MRELVWTNRFERSAGKFLDKNPGKVEQFKTIIRQMEEDAFHSSLKTHKLKGKLDGLYACSVSWSHRIVFKVVSGQIVLLNIGDHDEVY